MINFLLRAMLARSSRNLLLILGLLALSSGLSTYVSANQSASVKVAATLDENWRGSFDILVRPTGVSQGINAPAKVVESNYLSIGSSAISVDQWKRIQHLTSVEIAAPVAAIGYLHGTVPNMLLQMPPQTATNLYRVSVSISSTNGYRSVALKDEYQYYGIKAPQNPLTLGQELPANYKSEDVVVLYSGNTYNVYNDGSVDLRVESLPVAWTLVAAVDPTAERQLSGLDQAVTSGNYLEDNDGYSTQKVPSDEEQDKLVAAAKSEKDKEALRQQFSAATRSRNPNGPYLPLIYAASTYTSLPTTIKVEQLRMVDTDTLATIKRMSSYVPDSSGQSTVGNDQRSYLDSLNLQVLSTTLASTLDYGDVLKPISMRTLSIDLRAKPPFVDTQSSRRSWSTKGMKDVYQPGQIEYSVQQPPFNSSTQVNLAAKPQVTTQGTVSMTGETAFRPLSLAEPATKVAYNAKDGEVPFSFREIGSYDLNKLPESVRSPNPLTYVPLGIYTPPGVKLVRDAAGKELPGGPVTLHPTINPASFIPGPPLALTNIAAARFFRGDNCIDAIRVRVAGIDRYTPQNVKKVEAVAAEIIAATGLHVDIVSGSSPQQVLVYIPGSPDGKVAPLGYVEEPWTTLGAAASISGGIDSASVLMLAVTGLAGLLYLLSQSLLSTLSRRRELALLQAIGWRRRHISGLVIGEAAILGLLGGVTAVILALLLAGLLNLSAPADQVVAVGAVVFILYILASIGPALWVVRQPIAELLQRGEVALPGGKSSPRGGRLLGGVGVRGLAAFAWRNLSRRRLRSLLAAAGIAIATTLLMLISASLVALSGTLRVTLLGQFVGLQVQPYHYIMVGSALIVSILTVADHLAVGVLERRHELALLQAVGWRAGAVRLSLLLEGVWLGLFGGLLGAVAAVGVGLATKSQLILAAWWVVPANLLVILVLCSLSALYAISLTPRQQLVSVMQQQR